MIEIELLLGKLQSTLTSIFIVALGLFLRQFISRETLKSWAEAFWILMLYPKVNGYNILTILRRRKLIYIKLTELGEVFRIHGAAHVSLWIVYNKLVKVRVNKKYKMFRNVYEEELRYHGALALEHVTMKGAKFIKDHYKKMDYTELYPLIKECMNTTRHLIIDHHSSDAGDFQVLVGQYYQRTILFPYSEYGTDNISFHLNVNFLTTHKDENGESLPIDITEYQIKRADEIIRDVKGIISAI